MDSFLEYENELTMNLTQLLWKNTYVQCRAACEGQFRKIAGEIDLVVKFTKETSRCACFEARILYQPPDAMVLSEGFYSVSGYFYTLISHPLGTLVE